MTEAMRAANLQQGDSKPGDSRPGDSKLAGRLLILAAAVMWSTSGFFVKAPIFADWPADQRGPVLAFWRALFASVVLLPLVRRPQFSWRMAPLVLVFAAMNYTYLSAMSLTEATLAIWLQNTAPLWVFLVCVLVLREPVGTRDWLLVVFVALGVGLIVVYEALGRSTAGFVYGLLAGLTYAGVLLSLRQLRAYDSAWLVALAHLGTVALLSPAVVQFGRLPSGTQWLYLAGLGMFQMGIPYVLFARGIRSVPGHEAAGIVLLEPILVPVWVFVAYHTRADYQPPEWWTLVGGSLILLGLIARYARVPQRAPTPDSKPTGGAGKGDLS